MGNSSDWFANERFWERTYPFMFPDERIAQGQVEVEQMVDLTQNPGPRVLDSCCGPGRHAVPLAQLGYQVTAVDLSPWLLRLARERAAQAEVEIDWVEQDLREFDRPESFDLALNIFSSIGYLEDEQAELELLQVLRRSLRPGGKLVLELMCKEHLAEFYEETGCNEIPGNSTLLFRRHQIVEDWSVIENQWWLVDGNHAESFTFRIRVFSGVELKQLLFRAGFSAVELFSELDGSPFGRSPARLVAVAER